MIAQYERLMRPDDVRDPCAPLCQTCGVRRHPCNHPTAGPWWAPHPKPKTPPKNPNPPKRPKPQTPKPPRKYALPW